MVDCQKLQSAQEPEGPFVPNEPSLLKKYEMPVSNLDFDYIEKCSNARELEKIVHVLRSGEEGYYEALTKFAEEKLMKLKPNSKYLRVANPPLSTTFLDQEEQKNLQEDLNDWLAQVNKNNKELENLKINSCRKDLPAVRTPQDVTVKDDKNEKMKKIKGTDYASWDKYDPDTEILKMDIEEEKLKKDLEKEIAKPKAKKTVRINTDFATQAEAMFYANREKEIGNEFFKAGEFSDALDHYTASIKCFPCAVAYTNRALANIKLNNYKDAIVDCEYALKYDPDNIKAYVRITQSYEALKQYNEALDYIEEAITVSPNNTAVQELAERLRRHTDQTCHKSSRMKIVDISGGYNGRKSTLTETQRKSILKNSFSNIGAVIPIPGTSKMPPPYYIRLRGNDPIDLALAQMQLNLNSRRKLICMPIIDTEPSYEDLPISDATSKDNRIIYTKRCRRFKKRSKTNPTTQLISANPNVDSNLLSMENTSGDMSDEITLNLNTEENLNEEENMHKESGLAKEENLNKKENSSKEVYLSNGIYKLPNEANIPNTSETNLKHDSGAGGEPYKEQVPPDMVSPDELHSPFTFLKTWNSSRKDTSYTQLAEILRSLDMNRLVEVIGCKLDNTMMSSILQCLYQHFTVPGEIERVHNALVNLSSLSRIEIIVMLMSKEDRRTIQNLLEFLDQHGKSVSNNVRNLYLK